MDAQQIYIDYFKRKEVEIREIIQYYKKQNKTVALWGAGQKGKGFLEVFDNANNVIDYIFDKDSKKFGQHLESGHEIVDYKKNPADIVFIANSVFELEIIHLLREVSPSTKVINIDNIILGDLGTSDIISPLKPDLRQVRNSKICAIVVLYNPDDIVIGNIQSYAKDIDWVYLYDNSEKINASVIDKLKMLPNIEYIKKEENFGLPIAFNEIAEMARVQGYEWMITFDQDSIADTGMVGAMREYVNSRLCNERIAIVAPVVNEIDTKKDVQEVYCTYFDKVIQSGAMHNLEVMDSIGNYDEGMFIDEVDNEYCARCVVNGYKIVKINNALLMHNQQDVKVEKKFVEGTTVFINKFSTARYYYRYRNALYCYDIYKNRYPLYALDCMNTIRKMKLQLKYDVNYEEHKLAVEQAISDYENGIMGKRIIERVL